MKKTILISVMIVVLLLSFSLFGCGTEPLKDIPDNISYVEAEVYWGQSESFFVEVISGKREIPLNANGKSQNVAPFFDVKITPSKSMSFDECQVVVTGKKTNVEGVAKKSLTVNGYVFTTQEKVEIGTALSVSISYGDIEESAELADMLKDNLDWKAVLEISKVEFKDRLSADVPNTSREIFIKLARDKRTVGDEYFWYVCYIGEKSEFWSLLLDVKDGTIISKK